MEIKIIKEPVSKQEIVKIAKEGFGDFVKAVVDVGREIMAVGGELHADEEVALVESEGTKREHAWGINIFPERLGEDYVEFDSMINLKPHYGNRSRGVESQEIREKIKKIVERLVI